MVTRRVRLAVWWRRVGMGLRLSLFLLGAVLLAALVYWQRPQVDAEHVGGNLIVFLLVNFNIVVLCLLAFLVGRNIVKLIFDRRRNILGSKLRLRLVFAFVGLTLVPTIILFFLASGLLSQSMEGWFSSQIDSSVRGAVEVAKYHHRGLESLVGRAAEDALAALGGVQDRKVVARTLQERRIVHDLYALSLYDSDGAVIAESVSAAASLEDFVLPAPDAETLRQAVQGAAARRFEERGASQFVRAYLPAPDNRSLVATIRVAPELSHAFSIVNDSYNEYEQLRFFKNPMRSGYLLSLAMITGLILFAAIWIGFYMAREIAVPIQRLAEATREVARGNYEVQIRSQGDDEIGVLVKSFNRMISDLKGSRDEAEERRLFIETILEDLAVGVVALAPPRYTVTSINPAAVRILGIKDSTAAVGLAFRDLLSVENAAQLAPFLAAWSEADRSDSGDPVAEQEVRLFTAGRELRLLCTAGPIIGANGSRLGTVLLFDDVTELSKAQQMAAWREVARRVAHEIKNPLTPIQLSAQRLAGLLVHVECADVVAECTQTIVDEVDAIKRLADEFSRFARMPTAEFQAGNLNMAISDVVAMFAENNPHIVFQLIADGGVPEVHMDREQVRAVLVNLIENAVLALRDQPSVPSAPAPKIVLKTAYSKKRKIVTVEVSDNGPGISDAEKTRIFEPYYTTRSDGTGLGLAIVTSVVADHQGDIRVYDNPGGGAKFLLDLPIAPSTQTQRRLGVAEDSRVL